MLKIFGTIFSCPGFLSLTHSHTHTHTHKTRNEWERATFHTVYKTTSHNFKGRLHTQSINFLNRPYMQYQTSTIGPFSCNCKISHYFLHWSILMSHFKYMLGIVQIFSPVLYITYTFFTSIKEPVFCLFDTYYCSRGSL